MDCVILAGGQLNEDDPLYRYTSGAPKALLELGGRTLLERVIDALASSSYVDRIAVVGIEEPGHRDPTRDLDYLPDQGSLVANAFAGLQAMDRSNP